MDRIIRGLKKKAEAFRPGKDEVIAADHVVCGKACDVTGALGFFTPSANDLTVHGCSRGKIYKKTPPNESVTSYYLDADDRLIAISSKEQIDDHRTVIDYEEDVTYAFEWSLEEDQEDLECVTVCGYDSGRVTSCLTVLTTVSEISSVYHELFFYDEKSVVRNVKEYMYLVKHDDIKGIEFPKMEEVLLPEDWDFKTVSDELYENVKPYIEHEFTRAEAEVLMPFLLQKPGSAKSASPKKKALSLSSQKPLHSSLAKSVSKEMSLDELILSFRQMLDSSSRKEEMLLFESISETREETPLCSFRLVRQIPDGAGEFIQLELAIDIETAEKYPLESEWFQASKEGDKAYLDDFVDYIRKTSSFQALRDRRVYNVNVELCRT